MRRTWPVVFILVLLVMALGAVNGSSGTDLTASYVSCRLVLAHQTSHLYAYDPAFFNLVPDALWRQIARANGVPATTLLSPFVQTPLWPWALQPLCRATSFVTFNFIFRVLLATCFAGLIWLTGRYATTRFLAPSWVFVMAAVWVRSDPMREAMLLTQTHVIFLLLSVAAILWARSGRPVLAGILLAVAAAVKITPGVIVVYWLITRRNKAALSFVLCSVGLFLLTVIVTGREATTDYLHSMARVSNVLLLSGNNQSLTAWWMGSIYPKAQTLTFRSFPLPATLKALCLGLIVLSAVVGGYFDRRLAALNASIPPYGAIFSLLGAMVFTPIAWTHYSLLLVVPLILLLDDSLRQRSYAVLVLLASIFILVNSESILRYVRYLHLPTPDLVRGPFYAGILAMAAMILLLRRQEAISQLSQTP